MAFRQWRLDMSRIRAYWLTQEGVRLYKSEEHISFSYAGPISLEEMAHEFIFWKDNGDGVPLLLVGGRGKGVTHRILYETAFKGSNLPVPDGAGSVFPGVLPGEGMQFTWNSLYFSQMTTPEALRDPIRKALGV